MSGLRTRGGGMCSATLLTSFTWLTRMEFYTNIGSLESSTHLNPYMTITYSLIGQRFLTHGSLAARVHGPPHSSRHLNVVEWQLLRNYMRTPLTPYYLESSEPTAYIATHLSGIVGYHSTTGHFVLLASIKFHSDETASII